MNTKFKKLLEPGQIGVVRTKNRILKTGAHPGFFPFEGGNIQDKAIDYHEALAKGGAGIVTVGGAPLGIPPVVGFSMDDDKYLPGMARLVEAIRKHDCPAFVQMFHLGPMLPQFLVAGGQPSLAASSFSKNELPLPGMSIPKELTISEIGGIVKDFGDFAARAKKAGFQGVELNAACNHLLNSFLSLAWNRRQDTYGAGSLENRARIVVDIIKEIKSRNTNDFAVICLFNGIELGLENGITPEESQGIARILETAGADAIHVRAESYSKPGNPELRDSTQLPDMAFYPEPLYPMGPVVDTSGHGKGGWVPLTAGIKKVVHIPVIAVGRLGPELGEKLLRQGKADFISMNRRLMADHELPNKIAAGREEDVTPCTGCLTCFNNSERGLNPVCQVNAAFGKEKEYDIIPAAKKKRVMIVGGGPAGMEAARVAALRGHEVTLYEKETRLGGSMTLAAIIKGFEREDTIGFVNYLIRQVSNLGVDIRLGKEADRSVIEAAKPDVLIIAAGGTHFIPKIQGINTGHVLTGKILHRQLKNYLKFISPRLLESLSHLWLPAGKRVVIIGGGIQGCETAEFLVKRNRNVTIIDSAQEIGDGLPQILVRQHLLNWLGKKKVSIFAGVTYEKITDKEILFKNSDGKRETLEADTIITALPLQPNSEFVEGLNGTVPEIYVIGDCKEPHLIVNAVADGSRIARQI
jgi:2,4-dienoyl-CoA reductase (NADPH2)